MSACEQGRKEGAEPTVEQMQKMLATIVAIAAERDIAEAGPVTCDPRSAYMRGIAAGVLFAAEQIGGVGHGNA